MYAATSCHSQARAPVEIYTTNSPGCPTGALTTGQVSLKSVRFLEVTQLSFRTVVIQGFLIMPPTQHLLWDMHAATSCHAQAHAPVELSTTNSPGCPTGPLTTGQVSLKSVRFLEVTQLGFRTVVIQGFLIMPPTQHLLWDVHAATSCHAQAHAPIKL